MRKRLTTVLLSLVLAAGLLPMGAGASGTILPNFTPTQVYFEGLFTDVQSTDWFAGNVATAYRYDLMKGTGERTYDPQGNITVGQTVTIAARLHNTYYDNGYQFVQGTPWYRTYTDYAEQYGLIQPGTNYDAVCSRATFAAILSGAVHWEEFPPINNVTRIPDIHKVDWYATSVYTLYNAGVLSGSDRYGTFHPESGITRAEVSAILARIIDSAQRMTYTLDTPWFTEPDAPYITRFTQGGKSISVQYAYDWDFYYYTYRGDFAGAPTVTTSGSILKMTYGDETDTYMAYFYVKGWDTMVVYLVNTLTGEESVWYMYNLYDAWDNFVGIRLTNVFDSSEHLHCYLSGYTSYAKALPESYNDYR